MRESWARVEEVGCFGESRRCAEFEGNFDW